MSYNIESSPGGCLVKFAIFAAVIVAVFWFLHGWLVKDGGLDKIKAVKPSAPVRIQPDYSKLATPGGAPAKPAAPGGAPASAPVKPVILKPLSLPELYAKYGEAVYRVSIQGLKGEEVGAGTAFAVSDDGYMVTNYHVAFAGMDIRVRQNDRSYTVTEIVAYDQSYDLALIKTEAKAKTFVDLGLGKEEEFATGTQIAVIGGPLGLENTLTEGIISAYRDDLSEYGIRGKYMQLTAAVSPGSSGSPVFLMDGRLSGVVVAKLVGGEQINLAIPLRPVKDLLEKRQREHAYPLSPFLTEDLLEGDDPVYANAVFRRARRDWVRGKYSGALTAMAPLVKEYPKSPALLFYVADCLSRAGDTPQALKVFKTASTLAPNEPVLWDLYGQALERGSYFPQAIQALEHAHKLNPEEGAPAARAARLYAKQGDASKAIETYQKALAGVGDIRQWSLELARVHVHQDNWIKAYAILKPLALSVRGQGDADALPLLELAKRCATKLALDSEELDRKIMNAKADLRDRRLKTASAEDTPNRKLDLAPPANRTKIIPKKEPEHEDPGKRVGPSGRTGPKRDYMGTSAHIYGEWEGKDIKARFSGMPFIKMDHKDLPSNLSWNVTGKNVGTVYDPRDNKTLGTFRLEEDILMYMEFPGKGKYVLEKVLKSSD
jgi:S1-C subfamily serine protease/Flp pilus assembly protein TadD